MHKALALFALLTPTHADFDRKKAPLLDTTVDATAGHATTVRAPTRTQDEEDFAEAARLAGRIDFVAKLPLPSKVSVVGFIPRIARSISFCRMTVLRAS
jgi:hypothetical protein